MTLDVYADLYNDDLDAVGGALSRAGNPTTVGKMSANRVQGDSTVTPVKGSAQ